MFSGACWLHWWRTRRKSEKGNFSGQTQFRVGSMKRHKCSTASPSGRKAFVLSHQRPLCAFIWCWSCSSLPLHCLTTLSKPFNWEVDVDAVQDTARPRARDAWICHSLNAFSCSSSPLHLQLWLYPVLMKTVNSEHYVICPWWCVHDFDDYNDHHDEKLAIMISKHVSDAGKCVCWLSGLCYRIAWMCYIAPHNSGHCWS